MQIVRRPAMVLAALLAACGGGKDAPTQPPALIALTVSAPAGDLHLGDTARVAARRADGLAFADSSFIRYKSSDSTIVAVDAISGLATVIAEGSAEISAAAPNAAGKATVRGALVRLPGDVQLRTLAYGYNHGCGLAASGDAYCYGSFTPALGAGTSGGSSTVPVKVLGGLRFATVDADHWGSCGLTTDGLVYCWGQAVLSNNAYTPTRIVIGGDSTLKAKAVQVHADGGACALDLSGGSWCWGSNVYKQLAILDLPSGSVRTPQPIPGGLKFSELKPGFEASCGITLDGETYCWGVPNRFGNDYSQPSGTVVRIPLAARMHGLTSGFWSSCALDPDGVAYCWGMNAYGELGRGSPATGQTGDGFPPAPVAGGLHFASIQARDHGACGLTAAGALWCWGAIGRGVAPGASSVKVSTVPVLVSHTRTFVAVGVQPNGFCGIVASGEAYCSTVDAPHPFDRIPVPSPTAPFGAIP